MTDIIIIGAGPAGLSAAIYAKRAGYAVMILDKGASECQITKATEVENYLGYPSITGIDLHSKFVEHVKANDISIIKKAVVSLEQNDAGFTVRTRKDSFDAKNVILAMGRSHKHLGIEGEERLSGAGVSYCATCDGLLFKGKTIAIICTSKELEHEIEYLSNIASKVFVVPLYKGFEIKGSNIEVISGVPQEIVGNTKVEKVVFRNKEIIVDGVFMLKNAISAQVLVPGLIVEDDHIKVDRLQQTNLEGLFAAGDCTGRPYQYAKAIGEGNVAAHSATEYLSKNKK